MFLYGVPKIGLFLRVDNFVTVSGKVCDMSKVSIFCLKCIKLEVSGVKYSLHTLHKCSVHLKLCLI